MKFTELIEFIDEVVDYDEIVEEYGITYTQINLAFEKMHQIMEHLDIPEQPTRESTKSLDQNNKLKDFCGLIPKTELDIEKIVYPTKFTLFMESEIPDKLEPGLYYVCGDDPILKPFIEQYISYILKQTFAVPAGISRTIISSLDFFRDYISKSFNITYVDYDKILSIGFNNLRISDSKLDYYYSRNINPTKIIHPDGTPTMALWGQRVNYKDNILHIAEISALMTIAYCITYRCPHFDLDELKTVIQNLCDERFINEGDINITTNTDDFLKIEVTLGRIFYPEFIKCSYTVEKWKKLYRELTKIFIKE